VRGGKESEVQPACPYGAAHQYTFDLILGMCATDYMLQLENVSIAHTALTENTGSKVHKQCSSSHWHVQGKTPKACTDCSRTNSCEGGCLVVQHMWQRHTVVNKPWNEARP
jgi:radical SAM protein with 4Fe4S-binding SPASM domain